MRDITVRLHETAARIQREESVHIRNLRNLLSEAAATIEDLRGRGKGAPAQPRRGPSPPVGAVGRAIGEGGKVRKGGS